LGAREVLGNHRWQSPYSRMEFGLVLDLDVQGRTIWIVDARGDGKPFIMRADETVTAFLGT
jgi:hypothetical protein